ncbi:MULTISPECIES: sensor histidine kinase [Bacillaceae]|jgi:two-component system, NarL family, sensor histidine kinase DesK|uniref:histidine kinase n=1 Tax=Niallia hominis TaxID=3133173 RepID=A0ABV1F1C7_9BACI|nr:MULTISPECIES: sensor histidine kinase [Bacillaceae]MCM3362787.1 sensor histidine kinase [Niallia sp. MER TA 168]CAI9396585.1 Sensor histidine kinase DesK [Bacillus sp. T2.9-1]
MDTKKKFELFPRRFGFFPYIFLVYILIPVMQMIKEDGTKQIIGFLLVLIFLLSYRQLYTHIEENSFNYWLVIQILIVLIFSIYYDPNLLFMGYFPANFIGYYSGKKNFYYFYSLLVFSVLFPIVISWNAINPYSLIFMVPFFIIMLISPFGIRSMNRRMDLEKQLDLANEQISYLVKREERMRIARDLHDTLGHTLSLLTLKSQLVGKMAKPQPDSAMKEAKEMEEISRAALKQVRELVSDMRAITIREAIVEVQKTLQTAGIDADITIEMEDGEVALLTQNIISLCLKEAVTNIVKHSDATKSKIAIQQDPGTVGLTVQDNGKGLHIEQSHGNGLKGMRERLELVDGKWSIASNHGTTIHIVVPIIRKERQKEEIL